MMKTYFLKKGLIPLTFFCLLFTMQSVAQKTYYIGPNGNSGNTGETVNSPLTLNAAISKSSAYLKANGLPTGGLKILALEGTYKVSSAVTLGPEFKGTATDLIVIEPVTKTTHVEFSGSASLPTDNFTKVTDPLEIANLAVSAKDEILVTTVTDPEIISTLTSNLLTKLNINGEDYETSIFPNSGNASFNDVPLVYEIAPPAVPRTGATSYRAGLSTNREPGMPDDWRGDLNNPRGAIVGFIPASEAQMGGTWQQWEDEIKRSNTRNSIRGFYSQDWKFESMEIYDVKASDRAIHLTDVMYYGWHWSVGNSRKEKLFKIYGLLCEVDKPGEWYFDVSTNKLYVYPPENSNGDLTINLPLGTGDGFLKLDGTQYVHVKGLTVNFIGDGTGISTSNTSSYNIIGGCTFKNSNIDAVNIQGKNNRVEGCDFVDLYIHVRISGGIKNATTYEAANNVINNCHFYQKRYTNQKVVISFRGYGNKFTNNLLHHSLGQPINISGDGHTFEKNEVFNVGYEEGDGGAMYIGNDMTGYGMLFKNNFIHHLMIDPTKTEARAAIYLDDHQSGSTAIGNVFYKAGIAGLRYHTGAGHTATDNIFLETVHGATSINPHNSQRNYDLQIAIDADPNHPAKGAKEDYVGRARQHIGNNGWESTFWKNKYPLMHTVMTKEGQYGRFWPIHNTITNNYYYGNGRNYSYYPGISAQAAATNTIQDGRAINTSDFVDYDAMNFKSKSADLPQIPFEDIGLYLDEYRCEMPSKEFYRATIKGFYDGVNVKPSSTPRYINTGRMIESAPIVNCDGGSSGGDPKTTGFKFDFQPADSPIANDHREVTDFQLYGNYSGEQYGWLTIGNTLRSVNRNAPNNLNGDICYASNKRTFEVALPNQEYKVTVYVGDTCCPHDIDVTAEGQLFINDLVTAKNEFKTETFTTHVTDGKLTLEFDNGDTNDSDPNFVIAGIEIEGITLSTEDVNDEKSIIISPNPANDILKIQTSEPADVIIYDLLGKTFVSQPIISNTANEVSIRDLKPGIYIVLISTETGSITKKLIKK